MYDEYLVRGTVVTENTYTNMPEMSVCVAICDSESEANDKPTLIVFPIPTGLVQTVGDRELWDMNIKIVVAELEIEETELAGIPALYYLVSPFMVSFNA